MKKLTLIWFFVILSLVSSAQTVRGWEVGSVRKTTGVYLSKDSSVVMIVYNDFVDFNGKTYAVNYSKKLFLTRKYRFLMQSRENKVRMDLYRIDEKRYSAVVYDSAIGIQSSLMYRK